MGLGDALRFRVGLDLSSAEAGLRRFRTSASGMLAGIAGTVGFAAVTAAVGSFARSTISASADMEVFEGRLTTLMGSSSAARARLDELAMWAAETPFELDQIVAAETTLRGFGAAAETLLPLLIDFAATTGADMSQAAIDIGKAWSQGAVALESDWGRVLRKQVELRSGMDAASMSVEQFREELVATLQGGMFAGGAERLAKTFSGMVSTLKDEWAGFQRDVGAAGLFDNVKGVLSVILDLIKDNRAEVKGWATDTSDLLWGSFRMGAEVVGVVATGIEGIELGLRFAVVVASQLGATLADAAAPARELALTLARATGNEGLIGNLEASKARVDALAVGLHGVAEEQREIIRSALAAGTPLEAIRNLLAEAEARAAGMADEIEQAGRGGGATTAPSGGAEATRGGWEALIEEEERATAAAQAFYAEMMALDDTATERVLANRDERLAANLAALEAERLTFEQAMAAETAIRSAAATELAEIDSQIDAWKARYHDEEMRRIEEERNARLDATLSFLNAASSIASSLATLNEQQKEAHKAWATASVIIDAAAAGIRAFAELGPIGGAAASAAIALQAAAAIVQIQRQHQGGVVYAHQGRYPDEYDVPAGRGVSRRLEQEGVLNSQATRALGPQGVNALNGLQEGGVTTTVVFKAGRAVQTEIVRTSLGARGPIREIVRRSPSSSDHDIGFSGARAVA